MNENKKIVQFLKYEFKCFIKNYKVIFSKIEFNNNVQYLICQFSYLYNLYIYNFLILFLKQYNLIMRSKNVIFKILIIIIKIKFYI